MKSVTKRLIVWALVVALILTIPLVLTIRDGGIEGVGWNWTLFDFVLMGAVMFGIGLAYEFVARRSEKIVYRVAFGVGLAGAFFLFWVNGAVGIIGEGPVNMLYGAVFIIGLLGSLMARFKPEGMSRTLFAAALTQMLIPVIVLLIWPPPVISWSPGVLGVFGLNAAFTTVWIVSAMLFRRARVNL